MPIVIIRSDSNSPFVARLARKLPSIVSKELRTSETRPTPDSVKVLVWPASAADINTKNLEILVFAHDSPERRTTLDERVQGIQNQVDALLAEWSVQVTGTVIISLSHMAFGHISLSRKRDGRSGTWPEATPQD